MKIWHSIIIGSAIVMGFGLHAAIKTIPEFVMEYRMHEMQVKMTEMTPKEITVGDTSLLYLPEISYRNLNINVDYKFYTYVDGKLKKVDLNAK
ncbi:MAG: hypothetical protein K9M57_04730 [Phycisphaerae bacterium]|nr:hypothetical protein [Phycisphaerae bacterium]